MRTQLQATEESWEQKWLVPGRAHQLIVQCQMVSPENICMSNTIQTVPVILRNIYVCAYTYMHAITVSEKEVVNLKEIKEEYGRA